MGYDIDCLHHVGLAAADLDEAGRLYQRLGFHLTPRSYHVVAAKEGEPPEPLGTANITATFARNFVEVVGHVRADLPDRIIGPAFLSRFPGLHILTFNTADADVVAARLDDAAVSHGGVSTLGREVETADGPRMVRVRDVILGGVDDDKEVESWAREGLPEGRVQVVENLTPEYLLQERDQHHQNGAVDLTDTVLCVADDAMPEFEDRYSRYLGREARGDAGARVFELDRSRLTLVPDSRLEDLLPGERAPALPAFVAFEVVVGDLDLVQRLLDGEGFTATPAGDRRLFVPASEALGGAVIFRALA